MDVLFANAYLIALMPALAFGIVLALGRRAPGGGAYLPIASLAVGALWSIYLWFGIQNGAPLPEGSFLWAAGSVSIDFGFRIDGGGAVTLFMVSFVAMLIVTYAQGYMRGDPLYSRFFAYLALFSAAMLGFVMSSNLLLLFACWELIGLMSYALIGFWYHKPEAAKACKKAFMATRIGDLGLTIAVVLLYREAGSLDLQVIFEKVASGVVSQQMAFWVAMALFWAAVGKSAQFPLHVWLPDAMEGPTPVSALIHAATMVAAGVFLVWRTYPIFAVTADFALFPYCAPFWVALIGGFTAIFASTMAIVQDDIKRVLAYSTISQLGYMMLGLGCGALFAGMFHLLTHAFFKACLFMGAGSVIVGTHHVQDMRRMGGLYKKMPITFVTFVVATAALCGIGIPGVGGTAGFFSKDAVLAAAKASPYPDAPGQLLYWMAQLGAFLTAFYMARCVWLTFFTKPRDAHVYEHAAETPRCMTTPLIVLSVFALLGGFAGGYLKDFVEGHQGYVVEASPDAWLAEHGVVAQHDAEEAVHAEHAAHAYVERASFLCAAAGIVLAVLLFGGGPAKADAMVRWPGVAFVHRLLVNKYYLDDLWAAGIRVLVWFEILLARFDWSVVDGLVRGVGGATLWLMRWAWDFDRWVIDKAVEAFAWVVYGAGETLRQTQTGQVHTYLLVTGAAAVAGILAAVWGSLWTFAWVGGACLLAALAWRTSGGRWYV